MQTSQITSNPERQRFLADLLVALHSDPRHLATSFVVHGRRIDRAEAYALTVAG